VTLVCGREVAAVAPTSLVCLGTPLWWFRASSSAAAAGPDAVAASCVARHAIDATPARWRGGAGRAPLDAVRGAAPAPPALPSTRPEGAATHTASTRAASSRNRSCLDAVDATT